MDYVIGILIYLILAFLMSIIVGKAIRFGNPMSEEDLDE